MGKDLNCSETVLLSDLVVSGDALFGAVVGIAATDREQVEREILRVSRIERSRYGR